MAGRTHYIKNGAEDSCHAHSKFNRKFGARCRRYERWQKILRKLSEFEDLINNYDSASPEEVRTFKEIHKKLYECQSAAKHYEEELRPYERISR